MKNEKTKSRWTGIFFGPALTLFALIAIWKNETRFDFYRAAAGTKEITSFHDDLTGDTISFTGRMNQRLTIVGEYVESFTGYLRIQRIAEIYAWDKDKDSDGHTTWSTRWMSHAEANSRNNHIQQKLSSRTFVPPVYHVGELTVSVDEIELVDGYQNISPGLLTVQRNGLVPEGNYFYLRTQSRDSVGDERISYRGVPVPSIATYFGKLSAGRGVPDDQYRRSGIVNTLIQDSGVLHHIAAGDRGTALESIKGYLSRIKWTVRVVASIAVVLGVLIFFSSIVGWLYHIPVIGRMAQFGTFVAALAIGLTLSSVTMITACIVAHPLVLAGIIGLAVVGIGWIRNRGSQSQHILRTDLSKQFGHELSESEVKELEFLELAQLVMSDGKAVFDEQSILKQFARKQRWDQAKYEDLLSRAQRYASDYQSNLSNDQHLLLLIRLALADGSISPHELRLIRKSATMLGYSNAKVREMIDTARSTRHTISVDEASPALVG